MSIVEKMLTEMFVRLLNIEISPRVMEKLVPVIEGVTEKIHGTLDLDTVQGQNTFRALICSMVAHGWGLGMHPDNNPETNNDGKALEVKVCKDILVPMETLKSIRYVKKDQYGRVKKALFEPDQNARIWSQIDGMLEQLAKEKWQDD
ncbi:MAG: hypothetical protein GTO51_04295 [Candidatus Latescibacteria bacterium]|nr:hypothetical protein [Candidatus Latescibacterota bacterium]NIM21061.1 hypothetical protein [Candidatus Latescibacterota bacterium]NIM65196.1 hypothetical protein [Candidatus Latescibacterota bacterium]NIO01711.1 hypothetical protein [Candidatus Latescibacterota bacterium]NIO28228.1 hypothetical protein [Candidatus Latescibacterota bacterium]